MGLPRRERVGVGTAAPIYVPNFGYAKHWGSCRAGVRRVDNIAVLRSVLKCMKFLHLGACGAFRFIGTGIESGVLQTTCSFQQRNKWVGVVIL